MVDYEELVGMTLDEAINFLSKRKINYRISAEDKKPMILTCDYVPGRVNLHVENGLIQSYSLG